MTYNVFGGTLNPTLLYAADIYGGITVGPIDCRAYLVELRTLRGPLRSLSR